MGENTKIEWADHTVNFWEGCAKVAPGCQNCYAERFERRLGRDIWGKNKPRKWTKTGPELARKLNRKAAAAGRIDTVFVNDMSDFFEDHEGAVVDTHGEGLLRCDECGRIHADNDAALSESCECSRFKQRMEWLTLDDLRSDAFKLFGECTNLIFILVTKRPENIRKFWHCPLDTDGDGDCHVCSRGRGHFRENVWLLTSISEQATADKNIPELLKCRDLSPVLGVSAEPLLGPIDLTHMDIDATSDWCVIDSLTGRQTDMGRPCPDVPKLDWIIAGGESGHGARACHVDWIRSIRDQCRRAGVPYFIKQLGANGQGFALWPIWRRQADTPDGREHWELFDPKGRSRIDVSGNDRESVWHTYDEDGLGGENDSGQFGTEVARRQAQQALLRQGWAPLCLRDKKGGDPDEWPEDLRVREFPYIRTTV